MSVASLPYTLRSEPRLKWTTTQEKTICRDYPFMDITNESAEQFVVRSYLQFLWLPESIMPIQLLVPSLLRVTVPSTSQHPTDNTPHPLHALLEPLLLSVRAVTNKYHVELPQILNDGGGAGEIEENVMWFAFNYEKSELMGGDEETARESGGVGGESTEVTALNEEKWRVQWLERLERREVQIQTLLHFLILSLPGLHPPTTSSETGDASPKKRKRRDRTSQNIVTPSVRDRLESFMDKLSMWQLMHGLERQKNGNITHDKDDRDWMQVFCEDIVEPPFRSKLPDLYNLFRSKVFPDSPFSDTASLSSSRSPSPPLGRTKSGQHRRKRQSARSFASITSEAGRRYTSPTRSVSSSHVSNSNIRSRSRSLSITLAQDADARARRAASVSAVGKNVLNREVSMSRVFKAKAKNQDKNEKEKELGKDEPGKGTAVQQKGVLATGRSADVGMTLVADTPVKVKRKPRTSPQAAHLVGGNGVLDQATDILERVEEEDWEMTSSPDLILLKKAEKGRSRRVKQGCTTPVKRRRK